MPRWPVIVSTIVAFGALSGAAAYQHVAPGPDEQKQDERKGDWHEIAWPFPRDGWPAGKAFRCDATACGGAIELYLRPKMGFCNCDRGVTDDDEVDRVADLDLMSEHFAPLTPGDIIRVADMPGRIRAYDLKMSDGLPHTAVGVAVSRRCDLLVAVAHGKGDATEVRRAALDFLATGEMTRWMTAAMEGR